MIYERDLIIEISYLFLTELWGEKIDNEKVSIFQKIVESGHLDIEEDGEAKAGELMDDHSKIIFFYSFFQKVMGKKKASKILAIPTNKKIHKCLQCESQIGGVLKDSYFAVESEKDEVITCKLCQSDYYVTDID